MGRRKIQILTAFGCLASLSFGALALPVSAQEPVLGKWQVLHLTPKRATNGIKDFAPNSGLANIETLDLKGPHPGHPFLIGTFAINGRFAIGNGSIQRTEGQNAAVSLGKQDNFDLEGIVDATGVGGMFLLLGWQDGHGNLVYNVTMRESGSPWHKCEILRGKAVVDSDHEMNRYEWKGPQPLVVRVLDGRLSLRVGTTRLAEEVELENYTAGDVLIGTYDTKYGPRGMRIHSLRVREISLPDEKTEPAKP